MGLNGVVVVDEIEDIPVGETQQLTGPLSAGTYAHYQMGMRIPFTVE